MTYLNLAYDRTGNRYFCGAFVIKKMGDNPTEWFAFSHDWEEGGTQLGPFSSLTDAHEAVLAWHEKNEPQPF